MSEVTTSTDEQSQTPSELDILKEQATRLNITFHPSIGLEKLRLKVEQASNPIPALSETSEIPEQEKAPVVPVKKAKLDFSKPEHIIGETEQERKKRKREMATRLVRVRIACMNPDKKDWTGEILTISNSLVGSLKKYIPFNNEEGWHIPYMMYLHLKERQCQIFIKTRDSRGRNNVTPKLIKEFSVELLPDLTEVEMKDLAQRQAMASGTAA